VSGVTAGPPIVSNPDPSGAMKAQLEEPGAE